MHVLDLESLSLSLTVPLFLAASAVVWFAARRASRYAGAISRTTGLGEGFVGMILLALATSLPELGATATASLSGNAPIAANNLLGGVALQTAILAVADAAGSRPLTAGARRRPLVLQAAAIIVLLAIALTGIAVGGGPRVGGAGVWTVAIAAVYVASTYAVRALRTRAPEHPEEGAEPMHEEPRRDVIRTYARRSTASLAVRFGIAALVILVGGSLLAASAEAIAGQTALRGGFVGATLLALATSLPELSSTVQAARLGLETMAISNVLGSNAIDLFLLLVADALFARGPILGQVEGDSIVLAGVALSLTLVYLLGALQRRARSIGRMGVDSIAVAVLYVVGVVVVYLAA